MNPRHPLVREHIRAGGRAVRAGGRASTASMIALYDKGSHIPLLWTHLIPATLEGRALHNVQNAMFAARRRLQPGHQARRHPPRAAHLRHLLLPGAGPDERVQRAPVQGHPRLRPQPGRRPRHVPTWSSARRCAGASIAGARPCRATAATRTSREVAAIAAGPFRPLHLLKRDDNPRGREADEVPQLLEAGLLRARRQARRRSR